ncbi:XdhC family protein [Aureibaculum sp. 2210JD6-5]|uniref:XdhC family protein n=1 Tax=Aureibaculum sp. 2210JD6-5 TaxID=3103957 RepID=UPI002AAD349A|nr:XdhC family protein [Aureibaculum sp. 2210JD6-5]MDY7394147.1 XdhC family protein [Aureibaculum sp. 2210JD6-5]
MTHEFKRIVSAYLNAKEKGLKSIVATVVALEGSSYRKPGVRMLILENGQMVGAVSGGCVEKEILKQSASVFKNGMSKVMTYNGRYRLGCEGVLYILLELFNPDTAFFDAFSMCLKQHKTFNIDSSYSEDTNSNKVFGSLLSIDNFDFPFNKTVNVRENSTDKVFSQTLKPCFRLVIVGAEHDAVQLSSFATDLGWDVYSVASPSDPKTLNDFPKAHQLLHQTPETFDTEIIKEETAVVLMTHNYAKDLQFLIALKKVNPVYIGILGPVKRREKLLNEFIERFPLTDDAFFEKIHSPAGLNIGAITPQEIALSICAEILSITRQKDPGSLRNIVGKIHSENYLP